jgi:serine/threonine-protein kinase RsbW
MTTPDPDNEATFVECIIKSDLTETAGPREEILAEMNRLGYPEAARFAAKLSLEEALTNAVRHGNSCKPDTTVTIRYAVSEEKAAIIIRDEGEGFIPESVPDCTDPAYLATPSGRGILLMNAYMDEVCYRDCGREVYLVKLRNSTKRPSDTELPATPVRWTLFYSGNVQGVGFRATVDDLAGKFQICGYVKNLPDGRVQAVAEGLEQHVEDFRDAINKAFPANIQGVQCSASPSTGKYTDFSVVI